MEETLQKYFLLSFSNKIHISPLQSCLCRFSTEYFLISQLKSIVVVEICAVETMEVILSKFYPYDSCSIEEIDPKTFLPSPEMDLGQVNDFIQKYGSEEFSEERLNDILDILKTMPYSILPNRDKQFLKLYTIQ